MNVDNFDNCSKTATLKTDHSIPLEIGGMIENIVYRILNVDDKVYENDKEFPIAGKNLTLNYDFHPSDGGYLGYEHLCLFSCRKGKNYVKYFRNPQELESFISGIKFEKNKDYAKSQIVSLKENILKITKDYDLD